MSNVVPLLTMEDCAGLLRVSVPALSTIIWRGTAPRHMKLGKSVRFHPDDVALWMNNLRGVSAENENKKRIGRPRKLAA